jgi:cytochrome P450
MVGLPTNDQWSKQRRLVAPLFAEKFMRGYCPLVIGKCDEMAQLLESNGKEKSVDVLSMISSAAMDGTFSVIV